MSFIQNLKIPFEQEEIEFAILLLQTQLKLVKERDEINKGNPIRVRRKATKKALNIIEEEDEDEDEKIKNKKK